MAKNGNGKHPGGRPTKKVAALVDEICARLERGESATKTCEAVGISWATLAAWLKNDEEFLKRYRTSREIQAELLAEQILDIAEEDPLLAITRQGSGAEEHDVIRVDGAAVQHQKLRMEARKWFAVIVAPHKYSPRVQQQTLDKEGLPVDPKDLRPIIEVTVGK